MGWLFRVLELDKDAGNRRRLDRAVRSSLGLSSEVPCAEVQAHLDQLSVEERFEMIDQIERSLLA
jgi:hypothetical protein